MLTYCTKFLGERLLCKVAAFNLTPLDTYKYPKVVEWEINQNSKEEYIRLAKVINKSQKIKGVILQHEYGIFGGVEGDKILHFMQECKKPILTTLHTVLPHPKDKMKEVTSEIIKLSRIIIVLTHQSKKILEEVYPEAIGKVSVIPHGIHPTAFETQEKYKEKLELEDRIVVSTFGLLSRGKGIEYIIKSLPLVIKKYPSLLYLVLGETHPVIRRNEGEKYRIKLIRLVNKLGLQKHVRFYDQYLALPDLFTFLKATDIYIASSTNPHQAVSGTLSYALGAGCAVVSTQFAQAKEIVTEDIGRLVAIKKAGAFTDAVLDLLSDKKRLLAMRANAYEKTRYMLWSNVAEKYISLLKKTFVPSLKLDHLVRMTDTFGLFQFAKINTPDKKYGYTLDDNARALIVCSWLQKNGDVYFSFLKNSMQADGSFLNYYDDKHNPTEQNKQEDLEDTQGRALWALAEVMREKEEAKNIFLRAFDKSKSFTHLRAQAFAVKACALALPYLPKHRKILTELITRYANTLVESFRANTGNSWVWFEDSLRYSNGLLPESLLIAGEVLHNKEYTEKGLQSLDFLIKKTFLSSYYQPIGNAQWYKKNEVQSTHDQQPEDPAAMILALQQAYRNTQDKKYIFLAKQCFSWFMGNNSSGVVMYDRRTGGCYDGLQPNRVNSNQGAESLISYLMSWSVINNFVYYTYGHAHQHRN